MRNHRPDLNGLLVIDKPLGWSSAKVCAVIRRSTGGAKVGHAGTLDPLATGVLLVCLGAATKRIDALMGLPKRYLATIDLAHTSPTDDAEGQPEPVAVDAPPDTAAITRALTPFVGEILQRPPAFSAVHVGGERAYRLARAGAPPELPPRPVTVHQIDLVRFSWPELVLDIHCGKGTYIRSLARDLGASLGAGGRLTALRRTAIGLYTDDLALSPDALPEPLTPSALRPL